MGPSHLPRSDKWMHYAYFSTTCMRLHLPCDAPSRLRTLKRPRGGVGAGKKHSHHPLPHPLPIAAPPLRLQQLLHRRRPLHSYYLTLTEEGEEFGLDAFAAEHFCDEAQVLGCADPFLEGLIGEVADEV